MEIKRYDMIVVGAGPAGLSAAIEAAKHGVKPIVFDENAKPGGQLFKQIHKFFGSKEHKAKIRGFQIGKELLAEAEQYGVEVVLNAAVVGLYPDREITVRVGKQLQHYKGDSILIATGASENMVNFKGWTLPGVIGAGAAQTMMNLHHILPGKRVLMLGSGNVGLVVSFQLMQAGCDVVALFDAAPRIGGYGVHAAKVARCGVPFYLSHTIVEAEGKDCVTGVTIGQVGPDWKIIPGTEKHFDVDTICLAVGLSPMSQLLSQAGCSMLDTKGGYVPACDADGQTSQPGVFAAGDVSGIEEASSAMIEGRISGIAMPHRKKKRAERQNWKHSWTPCDRACSLRKTAARTSKRPRKALIFLPICWHTVLSQTMKSSDSPASPSSAASIRSLSARRTSRATRVRTPAARAVSKSAATSRLCRLSMRNIHVSAAACVSHRVPDRQFS